jgi:hypothetical protein
VLSSSSRLAGELTAQQPMPENSVVKTGDAAGAVLVVDLDQLWDYLRRSSNKGFPLIQQTNPHSDPQMLPLIKMHIDTVVRSLSAMRSYHSTTTSQNGRTVHYSWFHVEDIGR